MPQAKVSPGSLESARSQRTRVLAALGLEQGLLGGGLEHLGGRRHETNPSRDVPGPLPESQVFQAGKCGDVLGNQPAPLEAQLQALETKWDVSWVFLVSPEGGTYTRQDPVPHPTPGPQGCQAHHLCLADSLPSPAPRACPLSTIP